MSSKNLEFGRCHSGINYSIITVSDRCFAGVAEDLSGSELQKFVKERGGMVVDCSIVPDDINKIELKLRSLIEVNIAHVILTTGGTGFAPRDVTPEATLKVIDKRAQGLETAMTIASLQKTPFGMLSRAVCGIRKEVLIINLPGSRKGAVECLEAVVEAIPHAVALIRDDIPKVKVAHGEPQNTSAVQKKELMSKVTADIIGRQRQSKWEMVEDVEAVNTIYNVIRDKLQRFEEKISVKEGHGRVLSKSIYSAINIPAFDVSMKDGYAVRSIDKSLHRRVVNHSEPASNAEELRNLDEEECLRVTTGAPLPPGADSVVQVEDTQLLSVSGSEEDIIKLVIEPSKGLDVRKCGSDIKVGDLIAEAGSYLNSVDLGRIVSVGVTEIMVYKKPVVAVLSTGNEIVDPFFRKEVKKGTVYDSNRITLISILKKNGFKVVDMGIVPDEPTHLLDKLSLALSQADVVVSSGGVSMGEKDFLKPVLQTDLEATIHFGRVNMKPGKPTTFATLKWEDKTKLVFALPGNPSSSVATAILFVLPALRLMEGAAVSDNLEELVQVRSKSTPYKLDSRPEYYRTTLNYKDGVAGLIVGDSQPSSDLRHFSSASVLARLPSASSTNSNVIKPTNSDNALVPVLFINHYL